MTASAIAAANATFCSELVGKRNFDIVDEIYTAGARVLPPGAPMVTGRVGIKRFWSTLIVGLNATSAVLETIELIPAGDDVIEIGRATLTVAPEGQHQAQLDVKYVVFWRQEDGRWKLHVDIWNQNG